MVARSSRTSPASRVTAADVEDRHRRRPALAKELGVLSLPTTFILDADLQQRFRVSGVPAATDLRAALGPLTRPAGVQIPEEPGKLVVVQSSHELMLTRRRTVDLCRLGGLLLSCC